jgi:hypothetical protein
MDRKVTHSLLVALAETSDASVRNAIALQVADERIVGGDDVLSQLIQRPELANQRGTLVHALGHFDCSGHVMLLVDLVASGNFEVAHEALQALETVEHLEGDDVLRAFERLERVRGHPDLEAWRTNLLDDLTEMFE